MMATESMCVAPGNPALSGPVQRPRARTARLRPDRLLFSLIVIASAAGCGSAEPTLKNPAVTGPHGLPAIPIPGGLGYAEARVEPPAEATAGTKSARKTAAGSRKGSPARIAVYFLQPDGKTPLTPLPEKVQALLGLPGTLPNHYIQPYDLKSEPQADNPATSSRFASTPFPLPDQRLSGRVKAVVGGQEVSFPLVLAGTP